MDQIRVLIADDHAVVRTGLSALLDSVGGVTVVGEASGGTEAVRKADDLRPDVVVMDLLMPDLNGIEATQRIVRDQPRTKVLILTTSTVPTDLSQALAAGAAGAVTKSADNAELVRAIKAVAAGERFVSPEVTALLADGTSQPDLSDRHLEILQLVARGFSNPEIGRLVGISANTVKKHLETIFQRLGAGNRSEAIAIALDRHLLRR